MKKSRFKKPFKLKVTKRKQRQIRAAGLAAVLVLVGIVAGLVIADRVVNKPSTTRVWAANENVNIPDDLYSFLQDQPVCIQPVTEQAGVRLWAVMQVEGASFARLAYGCSTELQQYQMAVRVNGDWLLLDPAKYFADSQTTSLPKCRIIEQYQIPSAIEPFCINQKGRAESNG